MYKMVHILDHNRMEVIYIIIHHIYFTYYLSYMYLLNICIYIFFVVVEIELRASCLLG
jgi:hypothetical protein